MIFDVIIDPAAESDIDEIFKFYEQTREGLGFEFLLSLDNAFLSLSNNPFAYLNITTSVRRIVVSRFPYSVFYSVETDKVFVHVIMHQHKNPQEWQKRL